MPRQERQTEQSLTDRLPLARGAVLGAAAYVVGYILTYLFVEIESDADLQSSTQQFNSQFGLDLGTTDLVGWVFYNVHFVDLEVTAEATGGTNSQSMSRSINMLSEANNLTIPEVLWYLIPVIALIGAGYLTAKAVTRHGDTGDAIKAGATVITGYLPLAAGGAFFFSKSTETTVTRLGQNVTVSFSIGPETTMAIVLTGIIFSLVLGGIGGALASRGSPSSGRQRAGRGDNRPRQEQYQQSQQGHGPQNQSGNLQSNQGNKRQSNQSKQRQSDQGGHDRR